MSIQAITLNGYNAGWCDAAEGRDKNNPFNPEDVNHKIAFDAYYRGYKDVAYFRQLHGTNLRKQKV